MTDKLKEQIKELKAKHKYADARELLNENSTNADELRILAECNYKDLELHREYSYDKALGFLEKIVVDNNPKETLCLKGAIYKRKWEYKQDLKDLKKAISNYLEAFVKYTRNDEGYGGINSAFLLDVLANQLKVYDNHNSEIITEKAIKIRRIIIKKFQNKENKDKWLYHTLAQAYLGLNLTDKCKQILEEANIKYTNEKGYSNWEISTTYKYLKLLAELKNISDLKCILPLMGEENSHILDLSLDKKGLALSGGGFRASFFHLGTLAKLAEQDLLKDIEVISTVSGGSIIGVHYYLKLQQLLENKKDIEITQENYITLVNELIDEFFEIVQTNIRNSVLYSNFLKTLKYIIPFSKYSRTNRLGELYQERIYKKYKKYMKDLIITPKDWTDKENPFRPRFNNWNRKNKVPIIVINATNLNSGHNWQFQATKMGEPDYMSDMEIDKNNRFGWIRYTDKGLLKKFKNYSIGQAVACSSAVPMLFTPIVLKDLYEGYKLSISDGGVYDNQGFSGLLSEECNYIICSDASGQMDNQVVSHTSIFMTNKRTIDIQMDRARELIYEDMNEKFKRGILKNFIFTHLKKNISAHKIEQSDVIQKFENNSYEEFQKLIASVRTDLDTFSKIEAYSLMYNGYELMESKLGESANKNDWVFFVIKEDIKSKSKKLIDELALSKYQFTRNLRKWWECK